MPIRTVTVMMLGCLAVLPAWAQGEILVDYRDERMLDFANPGQWLPIAERIGGEVEVLGEAQGAYTAAGADEIAYLVSDSAPPASDPFPEVSQRIVVFAGDEQVADWALPADGVFDRLVTGADLDGDGISEVIAEGSFYNMGTSATSLSAIRVGETPEVIQTLSDVYVDSCEAGVGEQAITASAVRVSDGQLVAEPETLDCV